MGNIGDAFGTSVPVVGSTGPDYASSINDILSEVMARLSTRVPLSSVSFSSALGLNGQGIMDAAYIMLNDTASTPGNSPVNRITAFGGNFYWIGPSGPVQITNGASLNSAALGGITGDYGGAAPAQFRYDSANQRYEAYHNYATGTWAFLRSLGIDISANSTGTVMAQLRYGGAGTLTFTLPPTLPAATCLLGISSTGAITANPAINTDITLANSVVIKHGDRTFSASPDSVTTTSGTWSKGVATDVPFWQISAAGVTYVFFRGLDVGERLKTISVAHATAGTVPTMAVFTTVHSGSGTVNARAVTASTPVTGTRLLTLNTPYTFTSTDGFIVVKVTGGSSTCDFYNFQFVKDRP